MGEIPLIDPLLTKALSHPIRIEILQTLQNRFGCLQLVHGPPRRGAVENYFGPISF
jgi:hypothetical protein